MAVNSGKRLGRVWINDDVDLSRILAILPRSGCRNGRGIITSVIPSIRRY